MRGVCRGAQFLNVVFGGNISHVTGHVSTEHSITYSNSRNGKFYVSLLQEIVNSYYNYGIQSNDLSTEITSITFADGIVEAFISLERWILGIMWHPKRVKEDEQSNIKQLEYHFKFFAAS